MKATVKCELCDTDLEWEADGKRFRFLAHTPDFCRAATLRREDVDADIFSQH